MKEWVLAISMEQSIERSLPLDSDGNFEISLVDADGTSHPACLISGLFYFSIKIIFLAE